MAIPGPPYAIMDMRGFMARQGGLALLLLLREGFWKDLALLIATSVVIGALLSGAAAGVSDRYFGSTIDGILGQFGKYDLIVHVREEFKDQAAREISRVVQTNYPGAVVTQSVSVAGRSNFLIGLPEGLRNRDVLEAMPRAFSDVPGASGSTFIIEPRTIISGIEPGAMGFLMEKVENIPGVRFCFRDGSSIGVVVNSLDELPRITGRINQILNAYRVLEIRLPMGQEFPDAPATAASIVNRLKSISTGLILDITSYGRNSDLKDLMTTLGEMKQFLQSYATRAEITIGPGVRLKPGDEVILRPKGDSRSSARPVAAGPHELRVEIREVSGSKARGFVVAGNLEGAAPRAISDRAVSNGAISRGFQEISADRQAGYFVGPFTVYPVGGAGQDRPIGSATVISEKLRLNYVVDQSISLVKGLKTYSQDGLSSISSARQALDLYDNVVSSLISAQRTLDSLGDETSGPISPAKSGEMLKKLNDVSRVVDRFSASLETLDFLDRQAREFLGSNRSGSRSANVSALVKSLNEWHDKAKQLSSGLGAISSLVKTGELPGIVNGLRRLTDSLLIELQNLDVRGLRSNLDAIARDLRKVSELDTEAMLSQLADIKSSLPDLGDEKVGRSIKLIESYMGGQVIPGQRIDILLGPDVPEREALMISKEMTANFDATVSLMRAGMLEPGIRSEVYRIMREARSAIGTLACVIFTLFTLLLDHSIVAVVLNHFYSRQRSRNIWRLSAAVYMILSGASTNSLIYAIQESKLGWIGPSYMAFLGGFLGLIVWTLSGRINPINVSEIEACEAMGMPYSTIVREIIIPEARPGIFQILNRLQLRYGVRPYRLAWSGRPLRMAPVPGAGGGAGGK